MKLKDILARELKVWPHAGNALGQASDGTLHLNERAEHGGEHYGWTKEKFTEAEDWNTAWVTRAEWQAAVEALKAEQAAELKWPDGAEFMGTTEEGNPKVFYRNIGESPYEYRYENDDGWSESGGCPVHTPLIPRPTERAVEWDGVGNPPIGLACEYMKIGVKYRLGFVGVKVLCYGSNKCFLKHEANGNEFVEDIESVEFRPIRTQEQIAAEEKTRAVADMSDIVSAPALKGLGVSAQLEALYDAGYGRKQVTE